MVRRRRRCLVKKEMKAHLGGKHSDEDLSKDPSPREECPISYYRCHWILEGQIPSVLWENYLQGMPLCHYAVETEDDRSLKG